MVCKVAIIIGSTRPGRNGEAVAEWVYEIAKKRNDSEFELVDIKDFNLPLLDEAIPPSIFEDFSAFKPAPLHEKEVGAMLDQFIAWGGAMKTLRKK
jgi:NAD(P)H-dependent FMN reductase